MMKGKKAVLKKAAFILAACLAVALCFIAFNITDGEENAYADTAYHTHLSTGSLEYNGSHRAMPQGMTGQNYVGYRGLDVCPGETYGTATVLNIPADVQGTVNINIDSYVYRKTAGPENALLYFRLIKNSEILYPTDGGWLDISDRVGAGKVTASTTAKGGDKIYFLVYSPTGVVYYSTAYITMGMTINGVWFDVTEADHINSQNDGLTTDKYFGGTYRYDEILTYEYVSFFDYGKASSLNIDNYDKLETNPGTVYEFNPAAYDKAVWPAGANKINWAGAEYYSFRISNPLNKKIGLSFTFYEGTSVSNIGKGWTPEIGGEYYIENSSGGYHLQRLLPSPWFNRGIVEVPSNFEGRVLIPISSFEIVGWQYNSEDQLKFGNLEVIALDKMIRHDIAYESSVYGALAAGESFTISEPAVLGPHLSSLAPTYKTVMAVIDSIGTVTSASGSKIEEAVTLYNTLAQQQQALVTNYPKLEAAIAAYNQLSDFSVYLTEKGKDFEGGSGVMLSDAIDEVPSAISAWIKVSPDKPDSLHIGTIIGNKERGGRSGSYMITELNTFSVEIASGGRPKFSWKVSQTQRATFIVENVDVRTGNWLNLAFVRDVQAGSVACYIDGVKVAEKFVAPADIADFALTEGLIIGSDYTDNDILAYGFSPQFKGHIADVKLYSKALTAQQLLGSLIDGQNDGLICRVKFSEGEDVYYEDGLARDYWAWLENGSQNLRLGDYSFAVLGDTQMLLSMAADSSGKTIYDDGYNISQNLFYKNIQWLIANKDKLNLKFVMHMGDLTDNANSSAYYMTKGRREFELGIEWLDMLAQAGIPFSLNKGNHDTGFSIEGKDIYNYYYPADKYMDAASGYLSQSDMSSVYYTLTAGGTDYLIMVLDLEPSDAVLTWANGVVASHPDHKVIVTTHAYMDNKGNHLTTRMMGLNSGKDIWEKFIRKHENIIMVLSGHSSGIDVVSSAMVGDNGNTVWQFMFDDSPMNYYGLKETNGARIQAGLFAILSFADDGNTVHVNWYSADRDELFRLHNQFTIKLNTSNKEINDYYYTISFEDGLFEPVILAYGQKIPQLGIPKRAGYDFEGWYLDSEYTVPMTFDKMPAGDLALYAKWALRQYSVSASYNDNSLTVTVQGGTQGDSYQLWLKTRVEVDSQQNLGAEGAIWLLKNSFGSSTAMTVPVTDMNVIDGKYEIIVRIRHYDGSFSDMAASLLKENVGQVEIAGIQVNGFSQGLPYLINKNEPAKISVLAAIEQGVTFSLYNGGELIDQNTNGSFVFDASALEDGYYTLTLTASNGTSADKKAFTVYVYGGFNPSRALAILSLKGQSQPDGKSEFVLRVRRADGSNIHAQDAGHYKLALKVLSKEYIPSLLRNGSDGTLEAVFNVDFNNKYGIYLVEATAGSYGRTRDDYLILYYSGHARDASVTQSADKYSLSAGETVNITASGSIEMYDGELLYAYYREDASGWVLMRDYSKSSALTWTPLKAGIYNIQVRVKAEDAGSYEKAHTLTYTVSDPALDPELLQFEAYDTATGEAVTEFTAGTPYRLVAKYNGDSEVLYAFIMYSKNTGTVYLKHMSPNPELLFVAGKEDEFIITVRVIPTLYYGYKDISKSITINASIY